MATIGTAYVQILPSAQGMQENLEKALGGENAGKSLATKIGAGLKSGLAFTAKAAMAGVAAAGAAAVAIGKQALDSYAEYEQLAGGAELMFGDAYKTVAENAAKAYSTVQMSQNEYLQQANGFATGLKTALGGNEQAAAELADRIITAEADVVAATGNSQEAVQNAFNGIMKSNFNMLDNLQLGITPTKEGFQEVIDKVNEWNTANGNATKYQMGNLADMQSALVDYIAMVGVSGYAQAEAAGTIQGSLAMTKAAWQNLLTGMADDNANFDQLIDNFIDSALNAADNILPRIETIMSGLGKLITQGAKKILPVVIKTITENLPQLITTGVELIVTLITGIIQALPQLVAALPQIFAAIAQAFADNWPAIKEAGIQLMIMIAQGIAEGLQWIGEKMMQLGSAIQSWLAQAWENVKAAAAQKWAEIGEAISTAVETIKTTFSEWVSAAGQKVTEFVEAVHSGIQQFLTQIGTWIQENLIQPAEDAIAEFVNIGQHVVDNIKDGISRAWDGLASWFNGIWQGLFGNRNVNVNVNASGNVGGYATGLDYVPYDEFPAILHKGEAVLTAAEADVWRRGGNTNGGMTIIQNIQSVPQSPVEIAAATAAMFEQARWAV